MTRPSLSPAALIRRAFAAGLATPGPAQTTTTTTVQQMQAMPAVNPNINTSRAGTGPAPQTSVVIARIIIIYGPSGGLFIYNGTPSYGNPPVLSATEASTDPYGNPVTPVLNIGPQDAGHAGFDNNGVLYLSDSNAKVRIEIDPGRSVIEFFDASGAGIDPPIMTFAPASGTDQYGNAFPAGIAIHDNLGGASGWWLYSGASYEGGAMNIGTVVEASGGAIEGIFNGPTASGSSQTAGIYLLSQNESLAAPAGGFLSWQNGATLNLPLAWGQTGVQISLPQDGNTYDCTLLHNITTSNQSISSTTPAAITGISGINLAAMSYVIRGRLQIQMGGTAALAGINLSTTGALGTGTNVSARWMVGNAATVLGDQLYFGATTGTSITDVPANDRATCEINGVLVVTTAGSFSLEAQEVTSGDSWELGEGSYLDIMPQTVT